MSDPKAADKPKKPDQAGGPGGDHAKCAKGKGPEKKAEHGGHGPGHGQEPKEKHAASGGAGRGGHK